MQECISSTQKHYGDVSVLGAQNVKRNMKAGQWRSEDNRTWAWYQATMPSVSTP